MREFAEQLGSTFKGKRIAVIGDVVADQFLNGTISRVSREAPVFILNHDETETRPGGAANAAANIASLGAEPLLVGVVGTDGSGAELESSLEDCGVETAGLVRSREVRTTKKVRVLAGQPYATRQQVIRIDYEDSKLVDEATFRLLLENAAAAIEKADAVIVSDYGYGVADERLLGQIQKAAGERGIPLIADSRSRLANFAGFTSATPNQEEAEAILGDAFSLEAAGELRSLLGLKSLIVTLGSKGMALAEFGKSPISLSAVGSTQPVDVTGAGDTVIAAFSLGLASGLSAFDAATVANHAGGIVVMKRGTAVASIDEVTASLLAFDEESKNAAANEG
jgi:rfaE bifunctional protein kinase chain/domain